jgi:hypothetical protein
MPIKCLSRKKNFSRKSKKKKKLYLWKTGSSSCKGSLGGFTSSSTNFASLRHSLIDSHNEQLVQNDLTEININETSSSSSDYLMNSSATDESTDESTDEMEYENELFQNPALSSPLKIQGNKPLTQPYSPLKEDTIEKITEQLELNGFHQHFGSHQGGNVSLPNVKTSARRIAKFLSYTYSKVHDDQTLQPQCFNVWTSEIINNCYDTIFPKYIDYLENLLERAPNTVLCELIEIKRYLHWFVFFRSTRDVTEKIPSTLWHIDSIIKNLTCYERKRAKKRRSDGPAMEDLIDNRELPQGGLRELQQVVESDLEWFNNFKKSGGMLEQKTYNHFMSMLYSALYVYSPQGRISAIEDLKLNQVKDLEIEGYTMSTKFKTNASFGYQPVTTAEVSMMLLSFYINTLRPQIVKRREEDDEDYDPSLLHSSNSPLFLKFNRSKAIRIGDQV